MKYIVFTFLSLITAHSFSQSNGDVPAKDNHGVQVVEQMPEYPGGEAAMMEFIKEHIEYPDKEREKNIQGRVVVGFIVNEDGRLSDLVIKKSVSKGIDEEALRVVHLFPNFKPGRLQGKPVRVSFILPIMFKLAGSNTKADLSLNDVDSILIHGKLDMKQQCDLAIKYIKEYNYPLAIALLGPGVREHYPPALTQLGHCYEYGLSVTKDYDKAMNYYSEAADSGYDGAQLAKGYMYAKGMGVALDEAEAEKWYMKAAAQNNAIAITNIGLHYLDGKGHLPKNDSLARVYLMRAADLGYAHAQYKIGTMYQNGSGGMVTDTNVAMKWYDMAALQHYNGALNNYAWLCYLKKINIDKGMTYVKEAPPDDIHILDTYAALLFLRGEYKEAERNEKRALDRGADKYAIYLERYGDIMMKKHKKKKAIMYWKMALGLDGHSDKLTEKIHQKEYLE